MKTLITLTIAMYLLLIALMFSGCMGRFAPFAFSMYDNSNSRQEMHKGDKK